MLKSILQIIKKRNSEKIRNREDFDAIVKDAYIALELSKVIICEHLGIIYNNKLPKVYFYNGDNTSLRGLYAHDKNEIVIAPYNYIEHGISKEKLVIKMIATLAHEMTHYRQYIQDIDNYMDNYVRYETNSKVYRDQECEIEARYESRRFIKNNKARINIIVNNVLNKVDDNL